MTMTCPSALALKTGAEFEHGLSSGGRRPVRGTLLVNLVTTHDDPPALCLASSLLGVKEHKRWCFWTYLRGPSWKSMARKSMAHARSNHLTIWPWKTEGGSPVPVAYISTLQIFHHIHVSACTNNRIKCLLIWATVAGNSRAHLILC
jgi:hypothetical protein